MLPALLSRAVDLRKGETRPVLQAFAALFLIIAAHTTLETARDTIFLTKLPPAELNVMYVVLAGLTLVVAGASTRLALRFGRRNTLIFSLVLIAYGAIVFYFLSPTPTVAFLLYVFSGLAGALLAPQFWLLAARLFTVAQGRRLFGPIAAGGVLGGVAGAGGAMVVLRSFPVTALLPVAAALFLATSLLLTTVRVEEPAEDRIDAPAPVAFKRPAALFRENPFLVRVAALVGLSTAAVLVVDYTFKTSATRFVASADLGEFFATYYAVLNGVSLVVQVFLAGRITRSAGVIGSLAVMPFLLLAGGVAALVVPGVFLVVLILKGTDGGLRYSLNRVATELLYLPLPGAVREQGKTLIDSSLSRVVQAATAIILYLPPVQAVATPAMLALVVAVLSAAWLATAVSLRGAYLNLFRRTFAAGGIGPEVDVPELDLRIRRGARRDAGEPGPGHGDGGDGHPRATPAHQARPGAGPLSRVGGGAPPRARRLRTQRPARLGSPRRAPAHALQRRGPHRRDARARPRRERNGARLGLARSELARAGLRRLLPRAPRVRGRSAPPPARRGGDGRGGRGRPRR